VSPYRGLAAALVLTAIGSVARAQEATPRLGGFWRLVPQESDDARAKMREAMPRGGRGGFPAGPGGQPGSGPPGGGPTGGAPVGPREPRGRGPVGDPEALMREITTPPEAMTIVQSQTEIAIEDIDGATTVLHPDGKKWKRAGGAVETRASWKGTILVVESQAHSMKLTTTYELPSPGRLLVLHRFHPPSGSEVEIKRVYAADTPKAAP
jgi:hypothetical protein